MGLKIGEDGLELPLKLAQEVTLICGNRGSGKSTMLGVLLEEFNKNNIQFVVWDHLGAHREIILPNVEHLTLKNGETLNIQKLVNRMMVGKGSLIINVMDLSDPASDGKGSKQQELVGQYCNALQLATPSSRGKVIVTCIEEAEDYAPNTNAKWTSGSIIPLNTLTKQGRARGCGIILVTQRPQDLSAKLRSQMSNFICFRFSNYIELEVMQRQLVAASRGDTKPIVKRIYGFSPGESMVLSQHVPGGIAFIRTRQRETKHAGVNVLGEDGTLQLDGASNFTTPRENFPVENLPVVFGSREDLSEIIVPVNPKKMSKGDKLGIAAVIMVLAAGGITAYAVYDYYQKKRGLVFDEEEANHLKFRDAIFNPPKKDGKKKEGKDGEAPAEKPAEITENLDDSSKSSMSEPSYGVSVDTYQMDPTGNPFAYDPFSLK